VAIYGQPVISRETRRLLVTILVSVTALWALARIRFQERPPASTPVPNVLAQLRPVSTYEDLARVIADIRPVIAAAISVSASGAAALRIREDAAVTLTAGPEDEVVAADRATGLAIVRRARGDVPGLLPWAPRLLDYPRYLAAADVVGHHVALRPVFIGGLFPASSPLWAGTVWVLPSTASIAPGTFVFSTDGALAGLAVSDAGRTAIVPADRLFAAVNRVQQRTGEPGDFGITIQPLSAGIKSAIGAQVGVVVTAVDPASEVAGRLVATDVIEAVGAEEIRTPDHWRARVSRASAGDVLTLRVRNRDGIREVSVTARPATVPTEPRRDALLGLRLRTLRNIGAQVLSVQPESSGARAALREGDVITVVDGRPAPTSNQIALAFAALPTRGSLLLAVTRANEPLVITIEK
jgi:hypothetical protein